MPHLSLPAGCTACFLPQTARNLAIRAPHAKARGLGRQARLPQAHPERGPAQSLAAEAAALAVLLGGLLPPEAALATERVAYNPDGGAEALKVAAGVGYIGLVVFYFARLFSRRAKTFTTERLSSQRQPAAGSSQHTEDEDASDEEEEAPAASTEPVTALQCFIGAVQAGGIAFVLLLAARAVDSFFEGQPMPDAAVNYTAHNVTVLVQTIARGLVYLATFIFSANALGLSALSVKALLSPESLLDDGPAPPPRPTGPDVSVTDDIFAVRRAFAAAEREAKKQQQGGGSSDSSGGGGGQ